MRMTLTTATLAGLLVSATALAEDAPMLSTSGKFDQASGEALFNQVCQGCHMAEGQGVPGVYGDIRAGRYAGFQEVHG